MKPTTQIISTKVKTGWIILAVSLIIILGGLVFRSLNPALYETLHWVIGLGILGLGVSVAILGSYLPALRSAQDAARQVNSDMDERNLTIRNAAGYVAFLTAMVINYTTLYIYSSLTRGSAFDPMWFALAFLSVFPVAVFIFFMVWYQKRM